MRSDRIWSLPISLASADILLINSLRRVNGSVDSWSACWSAGDCIWPAGVRTARTRPARTTAPSESTLPLSRRSELIGKISADAGLMGNDHILPLRTEDGLVQRRAPALGQHIYAPG